MSATRVPVTVYLDPKVKLALKLKAATGGKSASDIVNASLLRALAEDEHDLRVARTRKKERARSYEDVLAGLKRDGLV